METIDKTENREIRTIKKEIRYTVIKAHKADERQKENIERLEKYLERIR